MEKSNLKDALSIQTLSIEQLNSYSNAELSDTFYTNQKKRHVFSVRLNSNGFILLRESSSGTKEQVVKIGDIVGGRCMRLKKSSRLAGACACTSTSNVANQSNGKSAVDDDGDFSAYLYVFAYALKKNLRSILHRERTVLTLRFRSFDTFEENMREAERWYRTLRWHLKQTLEDIFYHAEEERRRRVLFLLNPKSGSGKARELFNLQVSAVLSEAEIPYDLHVTKHSNYASDFVRTRSLDMWSCIVAVGGDGLFHEILNGLLQRSDWQRVLSQTALGIIPCGSGNGLARSIAHFCNEPYTSKPILSAVLTVIGGKTTQMDSVRVELKNNIVYSFLSVGWGLIADIDIESERLRALGYQRFTIWTLYRLANLRTYRGKVSYLRSNDSTLNTVASLLNSTLKYSRSCTTHLDKIDRNCFRSTEYIPSSEFEDVISLETSINHSFRSRRDSWFSLSSRRSIYYSISESLYQSIADDGSDCDSRYKSMNNEFKQSFGPRVNCMPPLQDPTPDDWIVEEGDFIMAQAVYQTHLGIDCFFAPSAKLNDGVIYLVIIRSGISRHRLLNFLINMSSGTHLPDKNDEYVKVIPVIAFRIEPYDEHGIMTVDGERVEFGPLQAEVLPGIARVLVPK